MSSVNIFAAVARLDLGMLDALKVEAQEKDLDFHKRRVSSSSTVRFRTTTLPWMRGMLS